MDARLRRVNKEIKDVKNDKTCNISIELIDDSPFHLKGSFPGPEDTPYEGGHYEVVCTFPAHLSHAMVSYFLGHHYSRLLPLSTSQDEVYHVCCVSRFVRIMLINVQESVSSECLFGLWRHLLRYVRIFLRLLQLLSSSQTYSKMPGRPSLH